MRKLALFALFAVLLTTCSDERTLLQPEPEISPSFTLGEDAAADRITALIEALYPEGKLLNAAIKKWNSIRSKMAEGKVEDAVQKAMELSDKSVQYLGEGNLSEPGGVELPGVGVLPDTAEEGVAELVMRLFFFVGLHSVDAAERYPDFYADVLEDYPDFFHTTSDAPDAGFGIIEPGEAAVIGTREEWAAVVAPAGAVDQRVFVSIELLETESCDVESDLIEALGCWDINRAPEGEFLLPVKKEICVDPTTVPVELEDYLLIHKAEEGSGDITALPWADPENIDCAGFTVGEEEPLLARADQDRGFWSTVGGGLSRLLLPDPLVAHPPFKRPPVGIGGLDSSFTLHWGAVPASVKEGLVSWWSADGHYFDMYGGNHGEAEGTVPFVPGISEDAFDLTGNGNEVLIQPLSDEVRDLQELTVATWVNLHSGSPADQIQRFVTIGGGEDKAVLRQESGGNRMLHFYMHFEDVPDPNNLVAIRVDNAFQTGCYHFFAGTYGEDDFMRAYLDGVEVGAEYVPGAVVHQASPLAELGASGGALNQNEPMDGHLDEVMVFDRALESWELGALYDAFEGNKCPPGPWMPTYPEVTVALDADGSVPWVVATAEEAMARVAPGGTILMDDGLHLVEDVVVTKAVTIDEVPGATAVIRNADGLTSFRVEGVHSGPVTIQNLDFLNDSPGSQPGGDPRTSSIDIEGFYNQVTVQDNSFTTDGSVDANSGVRVDTAYVEGATVLVANNEIVGGLTGVVVTGTYHSTDPGLYPATVTVTQNTIHGQERTGVVFQGGGQGDITFNHIYDSDEKCVWYGNASDGTIADNTLADCGSWGGMRIYGGTVHVLRNQISDDTPLPDPVPSHYHNAIRFGSGAQGTITENVIDGCGWGSCIQVALASVAEVTDNTIYGYADHGTVVGILVWGGSTNDPPPENRATGTVTDNTLIGVDEGMGRSFSAGAIEMRNGTGVEVSRNTITHAEWALSLHQNGHILAGSDNVADDVYGVLRSTYNNSISMSGTDFTNWDISIRDVDGTLSGTLACNWWGDEFGPDNNDFQAGNSPIVFAPWADGPVAGGAGGACTLGDLPDPYEPNEDPAGGWNIDDPPGGRTELDDADGIPGLVFATVDDPILGTSKITAPEDQDYFRFVMPSDGALLIQAEYLRGHEMMTMGVTDVVTGEFRRRPYRVAPGRDPNTIATLEGGREYAVSLYTVTSTPFPDPGEYSLILDPQPITASDYLGGTGPDLEPNDFNASAGANAVPAPPFSVTGSVFSVDGIIGDVDSYRILGDVGTHVGITLVNDYPGANIAAVFGWRPDPSGGVLQPDLSAGAGAATTLSHAWPIEEIHPHYLMLHSTSAAEGGWMGGSYQLSTWVPEVFTQISAGTDHSCGVDLNGDAMCWGRNGEGQLGVGGGVLGSNVPLEVPGVGLAQIDAGFTHSCGVDALGNGFCWGVNTYGQLGDGTTTPSPTPVLVSGLHTFLAIEVGSTFSCGVDTTGDVWCWGDGSFGKLGDGVGTSSPDPVQVLTPGPGIGYQVLSVGSSHACAYADTQHLWCWGDNSFGELGDGNSGTWSLSPVRVGGTGVDYFWKDVSAGSSHTCGIDLNDSVLCWGYNAYGQLGDETTINRSLPVLVTQGLFYADVNAAQEFTCGITNEVPTQTSAEIHCWGRNDHGQLGDGTIDHRGYPAPIIMDSNRRAFMAVNGGAWHTCAITVGQVAWCWGHNASGQLGDGTDRSILKPTAVHSR